MCFSKSLWVGFKVHDTTDERLLVRLHWCRRRWLLRASFPSMEASLRSVGTSLALLGCRLRVKAKIQIRIGSDWWSTLLRLVLFWCLLQLELNFRGAMNTIVQDMSFSSGLIRPTHSPTLQALNNGWCLSKRSSVEDVGPRMGLLLVETRLCRLVLRVAVFVSCL